MHMKSLDEIQNDNIKAAAHEMRPTFNALASSMALAVLDSKVPIENPSMLGSLIGDRFVHPFVPGWGESHGLYYDVMTQALINYFDGGAERERAVSGPPAEVGIRDAMCLSVLDDRERQAVADAILANSVNGEECVRQLAKGLDAAGYPAEGNEWEILADRIATVDSGCRIG